MCFYISNKQHNNAFSIIDYYTSVFFASLVAQAVKNLAAMWETWVRLEIPRRRERLPTSIFLPRESPRTEEPGSLQSRGLQRVRHN